jgi:phosphatidylserine/phosphatidylglycerophosphate/cardiolipin synthase-like enzyme
MKHSLLVLPDDSAAPILHAIAAAKRTLLVKMFVFSDRSLLNAVVRARRRGVKVRVMLNPARRDGQQDNVPARRILERARVEVKDANPAFDLTHEKSMVIDDETAFVQSLNWSPQNLTKTRDYAVVTSHVKDVIEVRDGFDADWHRQTFEPRDSAHLVWCPGPGRARICRFIDEARHRLFVQNERIQDMLIVEHLVRAARRGVKVDVMVRPLHTLKREKLVEGAGGLRILDAVGIKVHKLKRHKLHGKMMVADGGAALLGSINFAPGSLDRRRELAIEVHDAHVVGRLHDVARDDWEHSQPLDLSDEGLRRDLERRVEGSTRLLALHDKKSN